MSFFTGASVIRMLESFMGAEEFRKAIHNFLVKFAYKNAVTQDLFDELTAVSSQKLDVTEVCYIISIRSTCNEYASFMLILHEPIICFIIFFHNRLWTLGHVKKDIRCWRWQKKATRLPLPLHLPGIANVTVSPKNVFWWIHWPTAYQMSHRPTITNGRCLWHT